MSISKSPVQVDDLRHKRMDLKTELKIVIAEHQETLQRVEELQAAVKAAEVRNGAAMLWL
jgi:predicted nuclease with TOPRIM domain